MDELLKKLQAGEATEDSEFNGSSVILNQPEESGEGYLVHALNSNGVVARVRFEALPEGSTGEGLRCSLQQDRSTPVYWLCKMLGDIAVQDHSFQSVTCFDMASKTLTSVRDGVQEYLGVELGIEPKSKVFTVYRSPGTISAICGMMDRLPVIEDHIDIDIDPTDAQILGFIDGTEALACIDTATDSTMMLGNAVKIGDEALRVISGGKKQLSLGYRAKVRKHPEYDFEQYDIVPRHLAIVDSARGGAGLTFKDGENLMKAELKKFFDAESFSAKRLVELLKGIQDNIQNIDGSEFKKIIPALEKAMAIAEGGPAEEPTEESSGPMPVEPMADPEKPMDANPKPEDEKTMDTKDAAFKDAVAKLVKSQVTEHVKVIAKAKTILPETFDFSDKSPVELMRECLKESGHEEEFKDSELPLAFKMIKAINDKYKNFGDNKADNVWEKDI